MIAADDRARLEGADSTQPERSGIVAANASGDPEELPSSTRRDAPGSLDHPRTEELAGAGGFGGLALLGLLGVVGGAIPFLGLLALVEDRWAPLHRLDLAVADGLNALVVGSPLVVRVLEVVSEAGGGASAGFAMGLATVWLLIRQQPRLAAYLAVTGAGLAAIVPVTKVLVGRARPDVALPVVDIPTNASFPSGHAMTALVAWGALAVIALPVVRPAHRRRLVAATAAFVLLVGFTRIALGVHYVTDVVAGWALGAAWLTATAAAFRHWLREHHQSVVHVGLGERPDHGLHLRTIDEPALPHGRRTLLRLLLAAVMISLLLVAAGLLVTGPLATTALARWDVQVVEAAAELRSSTLTQVVHTVDRLGGLWGIAAAAVAVAALALAWRGSWRPAAVVVLAVAGEVLIYAAVSQTVGRARPDLRDLTHGLPVGASFPSGHVAAVTAVYGALSLLVLVHGRGRWRALVVAGAAVLVAATMASRVYLAAHHPTDTVAGLILSVLWLAALHRYVIAPTEDPPTTASWTYRPAREAAPSADRPGP